MAVYRGLRPCARWRIVLCLVETGIERGCLCVGVHGRVPRHWGYRGVLAGVICTPVKMPVLAQASDSICLFAPACPIHLSLRPDNYVLDG